MYAQLQLNRDIQAQACKLSMEWPLASCKPPYCLKLKYMRLHGHRSTGEMHNNKSSMCMH